MSKTLRILFLEDIPHDAEMAIATLVEGGYHCEWERVDTRDAFLNRLETAEYDLVLADYALPSFNGMSAVKLFRERHLDIPFILVSGTLGEEAAVEVLRAGASDFVLKNRLFRLPDVVDRALSEYEVHRKGKDAAAENARLVAEITAERERLNNIVANVPGVVWEVWSDSGPSAQHTNFVSSHVETMLGYEREEWLTTPGFWLDIVHADDRKWAGKQGAAIYGGGPNKPFEFRWLAKDGRTVWAEAHCAVINNENGAPVGVRGVTIDITERKRAEARFRRLVDSNVQGVFFWNTKGEISGGNDAFLEISGYGAEEIDAGQVNWVAMTPPEYADVDRKALEQLAAKGVCSTYEKEWIRKDGTRVPILIGAATLGDDLGDGVCFALDLTDRKQLENELRHSQKMEAVGVLAGGIAHDFNNLLTAINGYSDLILKRMSVADPSRGNVQEVRDAGSRAAALTSQLLAFSRKQTIKPVVHDVNTVISNIEKMLRRIIRENIELRVILDANLENIKADPGQIEQVVMNLVVNSRDAMPIGGTITIETQNVDIDARYADQHVGITPGRFVKIVVTDTGQGIDQATHLKIFEPFFTTKEVGKGTGLGLSIVYGIVKQSGGFIMVYSEVGQGTTFKIYLPAVNDEVQRVPWAGDTPAELIGSETILLVEDEDIVRNLVSTILTENGYKVLEATNGIEALSLCEDYREPIHLLLTDFIMPKMNGMQLKDEVVKLLPDIRCLIMSGYTDHSIAHSEGIDAGTAFIEKPFTPDSLSQKIRQELDAQPG